MAASVSYTIPTKPVRIVLKVSKLWCLLYLKSQVRQKYSRRWLLSIVWNDLVYFTTRVSDTSVTSATRATRVKHIWYECDTSETWATQVRDDCYTSKISATSATRKTQVRNKGQIFILKMTRVKRYFRTPIFAM